MTYLLIKIFLCLLLAGLLGTVIGWLLHKLISDKNWKAKLHNVTQENEESEELLYNYKKQNKSLNSQVLQLTGKIKNKENDNMTLAKSFAKIHEERNETTNELKSISRKITELKKINNDLVLEKDKLVEKLKSKEIFNDDNTNKLKTELSTSKDENVKLQTKLTDSAIYTEELERKQIDLKSLLSEKDNTINNYKVDLEKSTKSLLAATEKDKNNTKADPLLEAKLKKAESKLKQLEVDLKISDKKLAETEITLKNTLDSARDNKKSYESEKLKSQSLEKQGTRLQADINRLTGQTSSISKKLSSFESLQEKYDSLVKIQKNIKSDDTEVINLQTEMASIKAKLNTLTKEKNSLEKQLESSLETNKKQETTLKSTETELTDKLCKAQEDLAELETKSKQTEALNDELERYKNYLDKSEKRWASDKQNIIKTLEDYKLTSEKTLKQSKESYESSINELTSELVSLRRSHAQQASTIKQLAAEKETLAKKEDNLTNDFVKEKNTEKSILQSKTSNKDLKPVIKSQFTNKKLSTPEITVHVNKLKTLTNTINNNTSTNNRYPIKRQQHDTTIPQEKGRLPIETIEGIGTVYGKRLRNINVNHVDTLLSKGKTPDGRSSLAQRTDINESLITTWVQNADLLRLDGLTANHAELLDASGIHNVQILSKQDKTKLHREISALNKEKALSPDVPSETLLNEWINRSRKLEVKVNYPPKQKKLHTNPVKNKVPKEPTKTHIDKLTLIKGIGAVNEATLHKLGITTFKQIANFSHEDEVNIGAKLSSFPDRITIEKWPEQARALIDAQKKSS